MSNKCSNSLYLYKKLHAMALLMCASSLFASETIEAPLKQENPDNTVFIYGGLNTKSGLIDSAVKTEVLSSEEIEDSHYQNLSEAVSDIAGVSEISVDRRGGAKTALIQGFGENSVLVMIDGTPVSQNSSFGFDLTQISTENIEKIEVIKGGASALYGSQAIGGVINIVTKKPINKRKTFIDLSSSMSADSSDARQVNAKGLYSNRLGGVGHKFTLSYRNQNDYDLNENTYAKDGPKFSKFNGSLYLDKKIQNNTLSLGYLYFNDYVKSTSSKPYGSSTFGEVDNETKTQTHNIKLQNIYKSGSASVKTYINAEFIEDDLNLNDNPKTYFKETHKLTKYDSYRAEVVYDETIFDNHAITTGLLYKEDRVNQDTITQQTEDIIVEHSDIDHKKVWSLQGYVQDNYFKENYEISPGLRLQYDSNFGYNFAPKVSFSLFNELNDSIESKTWLTIGTGHRSPSIKERYFTMDHSSVANYIVQGNENLRPEKSVSVQLGNKLDISRAHSIHGNIFYNRISDLIETTELPSSNSTKIFSYENFDKVESSGIELGSTLKANSWNTLSLNYSYTETINKQTGLQLAGRPLYTWKVKHSISPTENIQVINSLRYIGRKYTNEENTKVSKGYSSLDTKINYAYNKSINLYFGINNLLNTVKDPASDTVIAVNDDRPSLGRLFYTGIQLKDF
ncbi:TonB-dependent receptor plug domain-containing protein [Halobacteriovorax marinus]|uniref:TonB-dependent receptor plug domain-containing protein n=1 Tax=Halobacteriovorax marinus TaxID=97084 RepID=UPI003A8F7F9B